MNTDVANDNAGTDLVRAKLKGVVRCSLGRLGALDVVRVPDLLWCTLVAGLELNGSAVGDGAVGEVETAASWVVLDLAPAVNSDIKIHRLREGRTALKRTRTC